jgi:hypothetical protein
VNLDDGVRGQLVEHGTAAARAAIELGALSSVLGQEQRVSGPARPQAAIDRHRGKEKLGPAWNLSHETRIGSKGLIISKISKSNETRSNLNEFYSNLKLKHSMNSK